MFDHLEDLIRPPLPDGQRDPREIGHLDQKLVAAQLRGKHCGCLAVAAKLEELTALLEDPVADKRWRKDVRRIGEELRRIVRQCQEREERA